MQGLMFLLMVACLAYNAYGVIEVGPANASTMQWVATGLMAVFVAMSIIRMLKR
jgi:hypothetical protein